MRLVLRNIRVPARRVRSLGLDGFVAGFFAQQFLTPRCQASAILDAMASVGTFARLPNPSPAGRKTRRPLRVVSVQTSTLIRCDHAFANAATIHRHV